MVSGIFWWEVGRSFPNTHLSTEKLILSPHASGILIILYGSNFKFFTANCMHVQRLTKHSKIEAIIWSKTAITTWTETGSWFCQIISTRVNYWFIAIAIVWKVCRCSECCCQQTINHEKHCKTQTFLLPIMIFVLSSTHSIALLVTYRLHLKCMRVNINACIIKYNVTVTKFNTFSKVIITTFNTFLYFNSNIYHYYYKITMKY